MTFSKAQAKQMVERVFSEAKMADIRVRIVSASAGHLRFGAGRPTTSADVESVTVEVTASTGAKVATVTGNRSDRAALSGLVKRAEGLANLCAEDTEHMPPLATSDPPRVQAVDPVVASMTSSERAALVGRAIRRAEADGVQAAGLLEHQSRSEVVANRAGLLVHHSNTELGFSVTSRTEDGTGSARAGYISHAADGFVPEAVVMDADQRAKRSQLPTRRAPARYPVILTAQAVADLMGFVVEALADRPAHEGRSVFSRAGGGTRVGETLFAPSIDLYSDPSDRLHPADPFDHEGRAHRRIDWIKGGVLQALHNDRFWAKRQGLEDRPAPSSLHMTGGSGDLDALVAQAERAVLVSRFWYNRLLSAPTLTVTGLTRDGTFWVENGKIVGPIGNFRFNDSPLTLFKHVMAQGRPQRAGLSRGMVMVMPPMLVSEFEFTSISDAV